MNKKKMKAKGMVPWLDIHTQMDIHATQIEIRNRSQHRKRRKLVKKNG